MQYWFQILYSAFCEQYLIQAQFGSDSVIMPILLYMHPIGQTDNRLSTKLMKFVI